MKIIKKTASYLAICKSLKELYMMDTILFMWNIYVLLIGIKIPLFYKMEKQLTISG